MNKPHLDAPLALAVAVTAGAASLLIASAPMFTALLARLFLQEELGRWGWLGIAIGFAGVTLITLGEGEALRLEPGALVVLLAAISASGYSVLQKKFVARYPPLAFTTYVFWAGTIPMLVFLPGLLSTLSGAPWSAILAVVYLGVFPGGSPGFGLGRSRAGSLSSAASPSPTPGDAQRLARQPDGRRSDGRANASQVAQPFFSRLGRRSPGLYTRNPGIRRKSLSELAIASTPAWRAIAAVTEPLTISP
ncbi:MAG: DMT family transporter [Candidatus Acetothermia bacterium]|nr:DMT family transporter [Candidatus Acetothermia bacterium]